MASKTKKILGALALTAGLIGGGTAIAPAAQATNANGNWWTNHSVCNFGGGKSIDTQGRYQNYMVGSQQWTRAFQLQTSISGYPGVGVQKLEMWNRWSSVVDSHMVNTSGSTGASWNPAGMPNYNVPGYANYQAWATYKVTLKNGVSCTGQWNIGRP